MRIDKCDRCKNRMNNKDASKEVSLIGFHGVLRSLDLCLNCGPRFVQMVKRYTEKKFNSKSG